MKASRGQSMRRASMTRLHSLLLAAGVALAASCEPQITILLVHAAGFAGTPEFVKFQVQERAAPAPEEFGPFSLQAIPAQQFAPVEPGTEFSIDVIGCPAAESDACIEPTSFNARGCTPDFITLGKDEQREIVIEIDNAVNGEAICPPEG